MEQHKDDKKVLLGEVQSETGTGEDKPIEVTFYDLSFHYKYFLENPHVNWVLNDPRIDNSLEETGWGERTRKIEEILEQKTLRNLRYNKKIVIGSSYPFDIPEEESEDESDDEKHEEDANMNVKDDGEDVSQERKGEKRSLSTKEEDEGKDEGGNVPEAKRIRKGDK